jgi:guanine deaminase
MKIFMRKAVVQAYLGMRRNHGGPFGAVIVKDGKVVARGHNKVIQTNDPTAHAEIVAIRRASAKIGSFDLSGCEIYSTCEPCPMCLAAIYWARIPKVYYGCTRRDAEKIGFRDKRLYGLIKKRRSSALEKTQTSRQECLRPFREWEQKKDKTPY